MLLCSHCEMCLLTQIVNLSLGNSAFCTFNDSCAPTCQKHFHLLSDYNACSRCCIKLPGAALLMVLFCDICSTAVWQTSQTKSARQSCCFSCSSPADHLHPPPKAPLSLHFPLQKHCIFHSPFKLIFKRMLLPRGGPCSAVALLGAAGL